MSPDECAEIIMTELRRQHDDPQADFPWGGGFIYDDTDLTALGVDGRVDILALARAIVAGAA